MKRLILSSLVAIASANMSVAQASDLDIFTAGTQGADGTIMLVLDNSGSMGCGHIKLEYPNDATVQAQGENCAIRWMTYNGVRFEGSDLAWRFRDGSVGLWDTRMTKVKKAMIDALNDTETFPDGFKVGLTIFETRGTYSNYENNGRVVMPARRLDEVVDGQTHRQALLNRILGMRAETGTPTSLGYAEAAAYLMGTSTDLVQTYQGTQTVTQPRRKLWGYITNDGGIAQCNGSWEDVSYNYLGAPQPFAWCATSYFWTNGIPGGAEIYWNSSRTTRYVVFADPNELEQVEVPVTLNGPVNFSGFRRADINAGIRTGTEYISPLGDVEDRRSCDGDPGIFFLTDGEPSTWGTNRARDLMNKALDGHSTVSCEGADLLPNNGRFDIDPSGQFVGQSAWSCISDFARVLSNAETNPLGIEIKTAVVGFGKYFEDVKADTSAAAINDPSVNCDRAGATNDARNACRWGENYGGGGSYSTSTAEGIAVSLRNFASTLGGSDAEPISTGTMAVPTSPLNSTRSRGIAYVPILEPNVGGTDLWQGNLKRYKILNGAPVDEQNNEVFTAGGEFNPVTIDMWNSTGATYADKTKDGALPLLAGTRNKIFTSDGTTEVSRKVYVENANGVQAVTIDKDSSVASGFNALSVNDRNKALVAQFLGFDAELEPNERAQVRDGSAVINNNGERVLFRKDRNDSNVSTKLVHGGVLHSRPKLIVNKTASSQTDYVMYGAFDGALHIVNDETGKEVMAFMPKEVLQEQADYLLPSREDAEGNESQDTRANSYTDIRYGVDGEWDVFSRFSASSTGVESSQTIVYGGLRMGGSAFYALDLSFNGDEVTPNLVYKAGSNYGGTGGSNSANPSSLNTGNPGYGRMGQSWGDVNTATVKVNGQSTMAHLLPGGFDMRYEDSANYTATDSSPAVGNAIYLTKLGVQSSDGTINTSGAGDILWWASKSTALQPSTALGSATNVPTMKNSVVSGIVPLDRDYDGYTDHLYFNDLGGQVFRVDIDNRGDSSSITRVVRLLNVADQRQDSDSSPRFFEPPLVTFTRFRYGINRNKIVGMVTAGSGSRSHPLHVREQSDRIYTFMDNDVAQPELFEDNYDLRTENVTSDSLGNLDLEDNDIAEDVIDGMNNGSLRGWYYPLSNFRNSNLRGASGLKMVNKLNALDGFLFTAIFNPNDTVVEGNAQTCSGGVKGKTYRGVLCLPYGSCFDGVQEDGTYTYRAIGDQTVLCHGGICENNFILDEPQEQEDCDPATENCPGSCDPQVEDCDAVCTQANGDCEIIRPIRNPERERGCSTVARLSGTTQREGTCYIGEENCAPLTSDLCVDNFFDAQSWSDGK